MFLLIPVAWLGVTIAVGLVLASLYWQFTSPNNNSNVENGIALATFIFFLASIVTLIGRYLM
jgi:prolipoprotein diacylglyceryltransferase